MLDFHSMLLQGTVPNMTLCTSLQSLRLTNNSFTRLPAALPRSLTHLYLDANPLNATAAEVGSLTDNLPGLHALSIGIVSVSVDLDATAVTVPTGCRVGQECSWKMQLYDTDGQPALTGLLVHGLRIGYNCHCANTCSACENATNMVDNRDGTLTATIPALWIRSKGSHAFHFLQDTTEFQPRWDGVNLLHF